MYTQGNHNPQPGQGPQKPMSSPYQDHLSGPPPLPQLQQGPTGFTYQHGPAAPPHIPPGGLPNTGQSYLHPLAHVHVGAPFPRMYPTAQQNSQHHSHLGTQNAHNIPQPVLPPPVSASYPEVSQTQPPFRVLPPPPPPPLQAQTFYRAAVNPPPPQGGPQHISLHPPLLPTTGFFTSAPLGSFVRSTGEDHHVPSTASLPPPPPPPSSPPPTLPSPPPSTSTVFSSPKPVQNASNLPCNLDSDGSKLSASVSVDKAVASNQVKRNLITDNGSLNVGGGNGCNVGYLVGDKLSLQEGLTVDLSFTPPKPIDENVIVRIEALCQGIAKNGPDYEDMVRKNESSKPAYAFLYGGEPGSEAAIAHDFFEWMKKKSILACKLEKQQEVPSLRPSENESSEQPCHMLAAASHLPDDSDMEMEDDITQIDDEQGMNHSLEGQCDISDKMLDVEEQLHLPQILTGCNAYKGILSEKISSVGSSRLGEQGQEGITNVDKLASEASVSKVNLVKLTVLTEQPSVTSLKKLSTSGQLTKGGSPFRLLQDYASDDNSEKDVETSIEKTNVSFGPNMGRDVGSNLENARSPCQTEKEFGPLSLSNMPFAVVSSEVVEGTVTTCIIMGNEHADNKHRHQVSANHAAPVEVLQKENIMVDASDEVVKFSKEHRQDEENLTHGSQHKLDKFGRLVRSGASDSDSDDSRYIGRHRRGRTRSRSWSGSPPDRRKRRSPRRRRDKRSLSRSWSPRNRRSRSRSPRNRRSRSRSPYLRHADEFSGENKRRVKGQMQFCFDFRRGRCYRGVSCRYLHHDSGKSDASRRQRSKQQFLEITHSSRTNVHDDILWITEKAADHEHGEIRGPEVKQYGNFVGSRDRSTNQKREDSVGGGVHNQDSQLTEYHMVKSEESRDISASVFDTHLVENKEELPNLVANENCQAAAEESHHPSTVNALAVGDINIANASGHASQKIVTSFKKSVDQTSFSSSLDPASQNTDCRPQQSDNSSLSDSSPRKASASSPNRLQERKAHPNTMELRNHPSHSASPSLPHSHGIDNAHIEQLQTASSMFQSSGESFPSYMLPNQQSYFDLQPKSSLTSLPPPPPPLTPQDSAVTTSASSHFWQSHLLPRADFGSQITPKPYPTELPAHSQFDGFQQRAYLRIQEASRPFLHASLPMGNPPIQHLGASRMSGDGGLMRPPMQNVIASNSFAQGNTHPHTMSFSQQLVGNKMQPFPAESLPPSGLSNSSSYIHPYSQQQQPSHSLHHPIADGIYNLAGKMSSSLKDPPDIRDATSHRVDIGGSTSSTFPNPYAPTLDQPINSKYHYDVMQEKGTTYNNTPFSLTRAPVDGRGIGSQQATSSPDSSRVVRQNFSRSAGDQYDPLFDSIEPSTRLSRDNSQKLEMTGDSGFLLGLSDSSKPLDIEEKNRRKDAEAVASAASADNEEFGEIADAEVGAVENGSPTNPVEANLATGEIEIDQIKSPGKSKKSKDSRSMKLFKVAVANFVKEVLKPSWQQGNISKEAFKTIVKKTVDKVSGAMKSHHIPKSRAKIDRYIESSQRKLTKLVMGYVDKYVKV